MKNYNLKDIREIEIIGNRWFDKVYGNTYHSVQVIINNQDIFYEGFTYGYGNYYEVTASKVILNILNIRAKNILNKEAYLLKALKDRKIKVNSSHIDVKRKKDL